MYDRFYKKVFCEEWRKLKNEAKKEKKGLFVDKNYIIPENFRHKLVLSKNTKYPFCVFVKESPSIACKLVLMLYRGGLFLFSIINAILFAINKTIHAMN